MPPSYFREKMLGRGGGQLGGFAVMRFQNKEPVFLQTGFCVEIVHPPK